MPMPRVLVIGAGATGSCAALRLRQVLGREVQIDVWEKARGPGGRMSTNRQELGGGSVRADMGAQYLSLDGGEPAGAALAKLLVEAGVCAEMPAAALSQTAERPQRPGWLHLAGPGGGVNDALKHLLEESGAQLHCEKRVASLDEQQGQWRARPFDGAPGTFDAVVVAVPGCGVGGDNLNKIHGGYEAKFSAEQNRALLSVQHDATWSFGLFLSGECQAQCDNFFGPKVFEKIVDSGPVHLLCYQSRKTAQLSGASPPSPVVVAHTTLEWSKRNARANGRDERLLREVAEHVRGILGLSAPLSKAMVASKVITWKQSQVTRPTPSTCGPCMLVSQSPTLVLAGDYFTESNFGGCARSGFAAAELVARTLKGAGPQAAMGEKGAARDAAHARKEAEEGTGASTKGKGKKGGGDKGKGAQGGKGEGAPGGAEPGQADQKKGGGGKGKGKGKGGHVWHKIAGS